MKFTKTQNTSLTPASRVSRRAILFSVPPTLLLSQVRPTHAATEPLSPLIVSDRDARYVFVALNTAKSIQTYMTETSDICSDDEMLQSLLDTYDTACEHVNSEDVRKTLQKIFETLDIMPCSPYPMV